MNLLFDNIDFFNFILLYMILPSNKNAIYTILKTISIFNLFKIISFLLVILLDFLFIIKKYIVFYYRISSFSSLIILTTI